MTIEAAQIQAAQDGYLLARLSSGLRLTLNGITVKRWPGFEVGPVLAYLDEQRQARAEFMGRK